MSTKQRSRPVDGHTLRQTMGGLSTGVAIITTECDREPHGMTVNSLTSLSLDPPLVLVCLTVGARTTDAVCRRGAFVVNLLSRRQRALSNAFARPGEDHFAHLDFERTADGLPLLPVGVGRLECDVEQVHPGGDHVIVIGRVRRCEPREATPLLFYRGRYHEMHGAGHEAPWLW